MTPEHLDLLVSLLCSVLGIATLGLAFVYHIVDVKLLKTPPLGRLFLLRFVLNELVMQSIYRGLQFCNAFFT